MGNSLDAAARPGSSGRLFTVGIPVFNGKALLRNCLESVTSSTLPRDRFEIVVVDDGSTEPETLAILGHFRDTLRTDPGFFRVISLPANSGGAARPRNRILEEATGAYVFFVDADDTIGNLALERISEALDTSAADWVALHQVPVNGRAAVCSVRQAQVEVPRIKALSTLTVHKVFRRAEIERQRLRFDEGLPSGQDIGFAFAFILGAQRFLMLGGYDYYYLTQHGEDRNEPAHLSRRDRTPAARIEKNERILRLMLDALRTSDLPMPERHEILSRVVLPRVLIRQRYLESVIDAGPGAGGRALRRLSSLLADPMIAGLDPAGLERVTPEHLAVIATADWAGLARLVGAAEPHRRSRSASRDDVVEVAHGRPYRLSSAYGTSSRGGRVQPKDTYFFHTDFGHGQSIRVDLGRRHRVRRIEVTNRRDGYQDRAQHLVAVLAEGRPGERVGRVFPMFRHESLPGETWHECGIDVPDVGARYVTITSPVSTALHFSDLRVYAAPDRPAPPPRTKRLAKRAIWSVQARLQRQRATRRAVGVRGGSGQHEDPSPTAPR